MTEQLYNRQRVARTANRTSEKGLALYAYMGPCTRCGGSGHYSFNGEHSRCYQCDASPRSMTYSLYTERLYTLAQLDKMDATAAKKAANKAAKAEAARIAKEAADEAARAARAAELETRADFIALTKYAPQSEFLADMLAKLRVGELTERQAEAVEKTLARFAKVDADRATSKHIGEPGERVTLSMRCTLSRCIYQGSYYGDPSRYLNKFETDAGEVVVYFTGRSYKDGETLRGTATVKTHDTYDGVAQTVIKNFRETKQ